MGSGTTMGTPPAASRPKAGSPKDGVGDGDRDGAVSRWHRQRGVEGGGGVEGGKIGQPDDVKPNFITIRVSCRRGSSPYTRYIIGIG
jgi:hypothetical protein